MICDLILTQKNDKYIAQVREWPGVTAEEDTRDEVISQVKTRRTEYLTKQAEVIQIEVPLPEKAGNPRIDKFGWFKDDPTFDDWQSEIAAYREETDRNEKQSE